MVSATLNAPNNGMVEITGPERVRMSEMIERYLKATNDERHVVTEEDALYYGIKVNDESLVPGASDHLSPTSFDQWFKRTALVKT